MITLTMQLYQETWLPDQWAARCAELNIVSVGTTPELALEAIAAAVRTVVQQVMGLKGLTAVDALADIAAVAFAAKRKRQCPRCLSDNTDEFGRCFWCHPIHASSR